MSDPRKPRPLLAWISAAVVLAGAAAFVIWAYGASARMTGDAAMSVHGWIALALALLFTVLLGGGLMWLAFYSSRKGYDDEAGKEE